MPKSPADRVRDQLAGSYGAWHAIESTMPSPTLVSHLPRPSKTA
jgi:hypothetical protein